jgi:hypothetical protein
MREEDGTKEAKDPKSSAEEENEEDLLHVHTASLPTVSERR